VFVVGPDDTKAEYSIKKFKFQISQVPPPPAEKLVTSNTSIKGGAFDELGYDFVAFNLRPTHVFSDTRLRQAFAYALDKQGIVFQAGGGQYDPIWTDVNKASWAYNAAAPQLNGDANKARQLLADAGWKDIDGDGIVERDGKPLAVSLYVLNDSTVRLNAANAMVDPLARVGISLTIKPADFTTSILGRLSATTNPPFDFDLLMLGWTRTSPDPDSFALFHSSQIPTAAAPSMLNFPGFEAPEYDSLAFRARAAYDFGARAGMYTRMQEIVADQLPYYFLWAEKFGVVSATALHGDIDFNSPRYMWNINQWWID
jgi:peptide/nickel transport system substrate-binding protein